MAAYEHLARSNGSLVAGALIDGGRASMVQRRPSRARGTAQLAGDIDVRRGGGSGVTPPLESRLRTPRSPSELETNYRRGTNHCACEARHSPR
jgi:hypothetical protein